MTNESGLLPCPFCGGEARMGLTNNADERSGYNRTFSAYCVVCSATIARTSTSGKTGWNNEPDDSIKRRIVEAWNTRALISPAGEVGGWQLVPIMPTTAMIEAHEETCAGDADEACPARIRDAWSAMTVRSALKGRDGLE